MLKKIPVFRLTTGMYIHDLNCGWMDHPFMANRFAIDDVETLRKIQAMGVLEVYIDTSRGLDVADESTAAAAADTEPSAPRAGKPAREVPRRTGGTQPAELLRVRKLHGEATRLVAEMMQDVRLGRQIELEKCEPVVEEIVVSIFRKPDLLLPLLQVKTRDEYTFQHSVAAAALAAAFGRTLNVPRDVIREVAIGGLLHDVGKAMLPDSLLKKPGKLTHEEYELVKGHVDFGTSVLKNTTGLSEIAYQAVAEHHERFDGTGYPCGLKGDDISIYGQMLAIVDVYDAITSLRPYHKPIPPTEALRSLFEWSKCQFNPTLVQAFIKGIGIYPAGSLVRMESGRLGVVREVVPDRLLQPVVKVFYDATKHSYMAPRIVELAAGDDKIVAHESFEHWNIDQAAWL
ncbi:MAG TPA: HD-GYP domain-containing protein [Rhodocyclaceae bacterium]